MSSGSNARRAPLPAPTAAAAPRQSAGSQAADYVRRLIFDGKLRPGDRIPQDDVADVLSLSRIPVREGLIALEREGWVRIELNRGVFVSVLDAAAVRDSYELYGLVYGFATRRALDRGDESLIDALTDIEAGLHTTDDPANVHRLTMQFHTTIVNAARSPRIKVMLRASGGLVTGNFFAEIPGSIDVERQGATAILAAIRQGDAERAAAEYATMLRRHSVLVVEVFEERGLFDTTATE